MEDILEESVKILFPQSWGNDCASRANQVNRILDTGACGASIRLKGGVCTDGSAHGGSQWSTTRLSGEFRAYGFPSGYLKQTRAHLPLNVTPQPFQSSFTLRCLSK